MGALHALVERAKAKVAADPAVARARYVVPLVCERSTERSTGTNDVIYTVWEQLEVSVGRDDVVDVAVRHVDKARVILDVDLAPLVLAAREELAPPAWDGAGVDPSYLTDTQKLLEERARELIMHSDVRLSKA